MSGPKVFVSYSHRDREALAQLQRFLKTLEREGAISAWSDTELEGGADWAKEIDQALASATVAVLLISQDFLASDFIVQQEIPRLLEREAAGHLTILPVFLGPSLVDQTHFPDPRTAGRETLVLSKFQGFGNPATPLSSLDWSARDRVYLNLSKSLLSVSGHSQTVPSAPPRTVLAATRDALSTSPATRAYELTLELEERNGTLTRRFHLPEREPIATAPTSTADIESQMSAIHQALSASTSRSLLPFLTSSPTGWGKTLFELLFGSEALWEPILRIAFGRPDGLRPNPTFGPLAVRIVANDPRWSGLPWRLTSWEGQPLVDRDWTFTTTLTLEPKLEPRTAAPSTVLLLMPRIAGDSVGPHDPEHERAVRDVLGRAWPTGRDPGYVQVARTRDELEAALRSGRPHLLYVYAHGTVASGRPSLLLDGPRETTPLPLADLCRLFQEVGQTPSVLYLNTEGLHDGSSTSALPTPDRIFGDTVPLLLWRCRPEWAPDSTTTALRWLQGWLGQGRSPVAALHQLQRDSMPPSCEACTVALHAQVRDWHTSTYQASPQHLYPSLRLDRFHQKALVNKELEQLVRNRARRVLALVPFASAGNAIELLWEQLRHDLAVALAHLAEIDWVRLEFPIGRSNLRTDLEAELRRQLAAATGETLAALLRRYAPRAVAPGRKPVLFLNWGTFGLEKNMQPPLAPAHLAEWLQFSSEILSEHCPPELQIVTYAALQIPASEYDDCARRLREQRRQPYCQSPAFRLSELPPVGRVGESDLLDFLENPSNSSCDQAIQAEVSERIIAKTGGAFEETVALLQNAENGSWYDLLAQLRTEQGGTATPREATR